MNVVPAAILAEGREVAKLNVGAPVTVICSGMVRTSVPPVAVSEMVAMPVVAVLDAARLSTVVPEPGAVSEAGVNVAVTPVGRPVAAKVTAELNPFSSVPTVSVTLAAEVW